MNNLNYYHFIPVIINFILSIIIFEEYPTGRYAAFTIFSYFGLFLIHCPYLIVGSIIYKLEDVEIQKNKTLKYWLIFNLPMFILVMAINIVLYLYGDIEGKINNNDIEWLISNNTMLVLWVLSSILFRYNSNYFK